MNKEKYEMGIDLGIKDGDFTSVVIRKGDEVAELKPEDYKIVGKSIILKRNPEDYIRNRFADKQKGIA